MEAEISAMADKLKGFANSIIQWRPSSNRRNPIEILKRLQREAFSDIMKLRDRQDKVEKILTFYKSSKGSPFEQDSTHVRGKVNALGALLIINDVDEQKLDAIQRSGIRTGISSRLKFETAIREKDTLVAEFVTGQKGQVDGLGGELALGKLAYVANVSNWFSAVAVPLGAQCRDFEVGTSYHQDNGLTDYSAFGPPLLHHHNGSALGIMVKKANVIASLAQFVSDLGTHVDSVVTSSTFGQVAWKLSRSTRFSLLGLHKKSRLSSRELSLGPMAYPVSIFRRDRGTYSSTEEDDPTGNGHNSDGSMALVLESDLDDSTRIGGWVETKNSNPGQLQWAVMMSDASEDEFGWGLSLGGIVNGPKSWDHFQVETFLNLNLGKRFKLQPGFMYIMDGSTQFPVMMLRSSWSF